MKNLHLSILRLHIIFFSHETMLVSMDKQYQQALEEKSILAEQLQVEVRYGLTGWTKIDAYF